MKYTINKNKWQYFNCLVALILTVFLGLIIIINKKFLSKIDSIMLKNYPHHIIKGPVYGSNLNYKNIIIYDKKLILAMNNEKIYNNYKNVTLINGLKGWIRKRNGRNLYNWSIAIREKNQYKIYHLSEHPQHFWFFENLLYKYFH